MNFQNPMSYYLLISIREFSIAYELLYFELESTHKMLNVNWETKIHKWF